MAPTQLNPTEQDALVKQIGLTLLRAAPADWQQLIVRYRAVGRYHEMTGEMSTVNDERREWAVSHDVASLFARLRAGMHRDGRGTWFNARYQLDRPSSYNLDYDREEPQWDTPPPPQAYADELKIFPRTEENVPDWLMRRLAGLGPEQPGPRFRIARIFDGMGPSGRPMINRGDVDEQTVERLLNYLDGAPVVLPGRGYDVDRLAADSPQTVPVAFHSDGTWIWPAAVNFYLRVYGVPPEPELVEHIQAAQFTPPAVPEATQSAAASYLTRSAPPQAPGTPPPGTPIPGAAPPGAGAPGAGAPEAGMSDAGMSDAGMSDAGAPGSTKPAVAPTQQPPASPEQVSPMPGPGETLPPDAMPAGPEAGPADADQRDPAPGERGPGGLTDPARPHVPEPGMDGPPFARPQDGPAQDPGQPPDSEPPGMSHAAVAPMPPMADEPGLNNVSPNGVAPGSVDRGRDERGLDDRGRGVPDENALEVTRVDGSLPVLGADGLPLEDAPPEVAEPEGMDVPEVPAFDEPANALGAEPVDAESPDPAQLDAETGVDVRGTAMPDRYETDVRQADVPPADVPQVDVAQADVHRADVPPADAHPADVHPADVPPADVPHADAHPADVHPADVHPADVPQADVSQVDVRGTEPPAEPFAPAFHERSFDEDRFQEPRFDEPSFQARHFEDAPLSGDPGPPPVTPAPAATQHDAAPLGDPPSEPLELLHYRLVELGVPESMYRIGEPGRQAWCLEETDEGWRVGWYDEELTSPAIFGDAQDAAAFMLGKLLLAPPDAQHSEAQHPGAQPQAGLGFTAPEAQPSPPERPVEEPRGYFEQPATKEQPDFAGQPGGTRAEDIEVRASAFGKQLGTKITRPVPAPSGSEPQSYTNGARRADRPDAPAEGTHGHTENPLPSRRSSTPSGSQPEPRSQRLRTEIPPEVSAAALSESQQLPKPDVEPYGPPEPDRPGSMFTEPHPSTPAEPRPPEPQPQPSSPPPAASGGARSLAGGTPSPAKTEERSGKSEQGGQSGTSRWPIQPLAGEPPLTLFRGKQMINLPAGSELDRFGEPDGNLTYADGTPFEQRSLVPEWVNRRYHVYRLRRPLQVLTGTAIPWFDQPGGGTAYLLPQSIDELLDAGALVELEPGDPPVSSGY